MHEILTIQLGHRANHVATHFWNAQESYFTYDPSLPASPIDHDIHFRPGLNANGEDTYTPRTLIYDLKGGFGGLRKWGGLYDQQLSLDDGTQQAGENGVWYGKVLLQEETRIPRSEYQRSLEQDDHPPQKPTKETVRYWSDYNRIYYHPRSIIQLNDYELSSSLLPFEKWEMGEELFRNIQRQEDILDRDLRQWAEECDHMQGIQVLAGADDAWAGFAASYVEALRDEFGKSAVLVWGVGEEEGKGSRAKQALRDSNAVKMITEMSTHASMYMPTSIPTGPLPSYIELDRESQWHTSTLLAAAIGTTTLPSRVRAQGQKRGILDDLISALNLNGNQRIARLQCSVMDSEAKMSLLNTQGLGDDRIRSSASPALGEGVEEQITTANLDIDLFIGQRMSSDLGRPGPPSHIFGGVECMRGNIQGNDAEIDDDDVEYSRKRRRLARMPVIERYNISLAYPILDSSPSIFTNTSDGNINILTLLSTTSHISMCIKELQKYSSRIPKPEEREGLSNILGEIAEAYEEGWDSGSGDDSDD
ncbi:MAG: hypothetical protein Q9163_001278 [Psora crenata]